MPLPREQNRERMRAVRRVTAPIPSSVGEALEEDLSGLPPLALKARRTAVASARRLAAQLDADRTSPRAHLLIRELLTVLDEVRAAAPASSGRLAEMRRGRAS